MISGCCWEDTQYLLNEKIRIYYFWVHLKIIFSRVIWKDLSQYNLNCEEFRLVTELWVQFRLESKSLDSVVQLLHRLCSGLSWCQNLVCRWTGCLLLRPRALRQMNIAVSGELLALACGSLGTLWGSGLICVTQIAARCLGGGSAVGLLAKGCSELSELLNVLAK